MDIESIIAVIVFPKLCCSAGSTPTTHSSQNSADTLNLLVSSDSAYQVPLKMY